MEYDFIDKWEKQMIDGIKKFQSQYMDQVGKMEKFMNTFLNPAMGVRMMLAWSKVGHAVSSFDEAVENDYIQWQTGQIPMPAAVDSISNLDSISSDSMERATKLQNSINSGFAAAGTEFVNGVTNSKNMQDLMMAQVLMAESMAKNSRSGASQSIELMERVSTSVRAWMETYLSQSAQNKKPKAAKKG